MLSLLFSLGESVYAIPARSVVEVVPHVALRPLPGAPAWVCGLLAYRGRVVPVVDLGRKLFGTPCESSRLSSRIVVVEAESGRRFGVLTERVSDVRSISLEDSAPGELDGARHVAATVLEHGRMIQLLDVGAILPGDAASHGIAET
jgi:chemotaxis-related protein WspB